MSDVSIDGFLKSNPPKADLKSKFQQEFARHCYSIIEEDDVFDPTSTDDKENVLRERKPGYASEEDESLLKTKYDKLKTKYDTLRMQLKMPNDEVLEEDFCLVGSNTCSNSLVSSTPDKQKPVDKCPEYYEVGKHSIVPESNKIISNENSSVVRALGISDDVKEEISPDNQNILIKEENNDNR